MAVFDGKTQMRINPKELASSPSSAVEPQPKTLIASGGKRKEFFGEQKRSPDKLKKQWQVYESGGLYASAIDAYAYSIFANGWRLEGKESLVQEVEDNFAGFDFDTVGMQGVIQSLVFGDSIQEAANGRGGKNGAPVAIMMRDSSTFDWETDDYGIIQSYSQKLAKGGLNETAKKFDPKQLIHLQLIPSGDKYGISLIQRAWDELMRDTRTAEASAEAIDRHGFKKYHVKIGQPGELVKQEVIDDVSDEFEDITTKNEFTTSADVDIKELDEGGLEKIEEYNNISLMRVAAALGIPEEAVGIRRGSTDATAVSRMEFWLKTNISAKQRTVARTYTLQYIDRIVPPGEVKLVFNDIDSTQESSDASWISKIMLASPENPFAVLPPEWIQGRLGVTVQKTLDGKTLPSKDSVTSSKKVVAGT